MNKALFLDRDGVINEDNGYVYKINDFHFIDGIFDLCKAAQSLGYLLVIVSNQAGIARGYYTEDDYHILNDWMLCEFKLRGVNITSAYFSPYHAKHGMGKYKKDSQDRKPNPGMIIKARDEFNIDLALSILIGDKMSDIEAGRRAGIGRLCFLKGKYPFMPSEDVKCYESHNEIVDEILK